METKTKTKNKWGIPLKHLMGNDKTELRAELKKEGARFDSKTSEWVMAGETQYMSTLQRLGLVPRDQKPIPPAVLPPVDQVQVVGVKLPGGRVLPVEQPRLPEVERVKLPEGKVLQIMREAPGVVEVGDVTEGGLLERDAAGRVVQKPVLKMQPSRFVLINMPVEGIRQVRRLGRREDRSQERGKFAGLESVTVTTTTEQTWVLPEEKEATEKKRGELRHDLAKMGTRVVPGLIALPLALEEKFDTELTRVKQAAGEHNLQTQVWKIFVNVVRLDAVTSDEEALARKVTYDMQKMLDEVTAALEACDLQKLEAVAKELKYKSDGMAPGMMKGAVEAAVAQAREMRSFIKRETEKKKRSWDEVKAELDTSIVESARLMLDAYAMPDEIEAVEVVDSGRLSGLLDEPLPATPFPAAGGNGNVNGNGNGNGGGVGVLPDASGADFSRLAGLLPVS